MAKKTIRKGKLIKDDAMDPTADNPVIEKPLDDFLATGLLWFVNRTLHLFGWVLVYNPETKILVPARTVFRGFAEKDEAQQFIKVSKYISDMGPKLLKEAMDE